MTLAKTKKVNVTNSDLLGDDVNRASIPTKDEKSSRKKERKPKTPLPTPATSETETEDHNASLIQKQKKTKKKVQAVLEEKTPEKKDDNTLMPPSPPKFQTQKTDQSKNAWRECIKKFGGIPKKDSPKYNEMMVYYNNLKKESKAGRKSSDN